MTKEEKREYGRMYWLANKERLRQYHKNYYQQYIRRGSEPLRRNFTEEEKGYIEAHVNSMTVGEIAKQLKRASGSVSCFIKINKLRDTSIPFTKWSLKRAQELIKMYNEGVSYKTIARTYNIKEKSIRNTVLVCSRRYGIEYKRRKKVS